MKFFITITLIILACTRPISATPEEVDQELIIIGTHIHKTAAAEKLYKVIITSEDISAIASDSFADVLRGVPGIDIMEQGGQGGLTFLSVRGGDPNFTVILIDGVKVNDPTNSRGGAFDLGTIDPAIIDKVEIYYGGFSTVYGSDALAGIVSIKTKGVEQDRQSTVTIKGGSSDTRGGSIHYGADLDGIAEFNITGSIQDKDNSYFGDAFNRKQITTSLKSVQQSDSYWYISAFNAEGQAKIFPEDSGGDRLAVIRTPESREYTQRNLSTHFQQLISDGFHLDFNATWSKRQEDISNPGIAAGVLDPVPPIDSLSEYERKDLALTTNYSISEQLVLATGISYAKEDGGMDSTIDFGFPVPASYTLKRNNRALFVEAGLDPTEKLHVTAGIRHDKTQHISVTTRRFSSRYQLSESSFLSAQYSEGFKLPSFFALGHPFIGNQELMPEHSKNYDLSINNYFLNQKVSTRLSIYQNNFRDLVDFDPELFTNINRSKVQAKGSEFYINYTVSEKLKISAQVSYNNIDTFDPTTVLRRRPEWKTSLGFTYKPVDALSLTGRYTDNKDYYDSSIATGMIKMQGYNRFDLSAVWAISTDFDIRINLMNLFDNNYEEAIGFTDTGRRLTVSLSKSF